MTVFRSFLRIGQVGSIQTTGGFRLNNVELECWMSADRVYLHKPGESASQDMPLDINDDGTLQSPFGELKRKGS